MPDGNPRDMAMSNGLPLLDYGDGNRCRPITTSVSVLSRFVDDLGVSARSRGWFSDLKILTLLTLAFLASAILSVQFARFDGGVAYIWGASGILLAYLAQAPYLRWPLVTALCGGALIVEVTLFGMGWQAVPTLVPALLLEPLLAAYILRRFGGSGIDTQSLRGMAWFLIAAAIVAPVFSGVIGAFAVAPFSNVPRHLNFIHWYAAHALGAVVATPIASGLIGGNLHARVADMDKKTVIETALLLGVGALIASIVFTQTTLPLLFVPLLPMVYATMRGGRMAAILSIVILGVIGGLWTAQGYGPIQLIHASHGARALFLQAYIAAAALVVLPIAALLTQQKFLTERWQLSEARYRAIADSLGDAVLDISSDGVIRYASPSFETLFGLPGTALTGTLAQNFVLDADRAHVTSVYVQAVAAPGRVHLVQFRGPERTGLPPKWLEASVRTIVAENRIDGLVASVRDISDRKAREFELEEEASLDPLTRLANRRRFMADLSRRCRQVSANEGEGSLAIFDLDHFKMVNDTYGHAVGDLVLKAVADAASGLVRSQDCVARIGGEEFAVIFWNLRADLAEVAADRLRYSIEKLRINTEAGDVVRVTASLGLASLIKSVDPEEVLRQADLAMYDAKRSGRNRLRVVA